ncbi:MAG TPA: hypothetical protein VIJ12_10400 [Candidatus Baltobacteraceae bacterium]
MSHKVVWTRVAVLACVAVAIVFVVGVLLAGKGMPLHAPLQLPIVMHGGKFVNHRLNNKSWSLDFDSAQMTPDQSSGTITGIHNGIIFRKGKPYLEISARQVSVNTITLDFTATGLVHVTALQGNAPRSFDTDSIVWTNSTHLLKLDHPAYFHTGGQTLDVDHVVVNVDTQDIKIGKIDGAVGVP